MNCLANILGSKAHEPLHCPKPDAPADTDDDHHIVRFTPGDHIEGPAGTIHICKHCRLVYFEADQ